jgi:HipA-like protein
MARRPARPPLKTYLNGRLVGRLRRESSGAIDFKYDQSWLDWASAIPVSLSMPLREDRYIGDPVLAVFENLLPDNADIRRRLAERSQAEGSDPYSLLSAVGRDCIGALQFLPDGMAAGQPGAIDARALSDEEVAKIVSDYESDGGPGIRDIYDLLKGSDSPEEDQKILFKAQIVFWLLGATDGHAKNFSVRLSPGGRFRLTPLYDIVSAQPSLDTKQISRNRMKLVMAVGKNRHYVVHTILGRHFKQTADACGLPPKAFNQIVQELGDTAKQKIDETLSKLSPDFPAAVAQSISDGAKRRIGALAAA